MLKKLIKRPLEGYKDKYIDECKRKNFAIFLPTALALGLSQVALIIFQYIRLREELFDYFIFTIYVTTAIGTLLFYTVFSLYRSKKIKRHRTYVDMGYVFFVLSIAIITDVDQILIAPSNTLITAAVFMIASILHFSLHKTIALIFYTIVLFSLTVSFVEMSTALHFELVLDVVVICIMSMALTIPFHNARVQSFNQKIEIEKANEALRISNEKLELLNKQLEINAMIDALTGVYNRHAFNNQLKNSWDATIAKEEPISVIMLDVDYFKVYNDHFGHVKGDECLKQVAQLIKSSLKRASDEVFRYGGEEFVVLLPSVDKTGAEIVVNRIMSRVKTAEIPTVGEGKIITVSAGLYTMYPTVISTVQDIVEKADKALYQSKEEGRNRYTVYKD